VSATTWGDLITHAAREGNILEAGQPALPGEEAQFLTDRLVMMVDSWNLDPTLVPWYQQQIFSLVPNQQSYLIGPNAPDWNAPRPIRLDPDATNLILTSATPNVRLPLAVLTVEQWANISIPSLAITFPQGCYLDRSVVTGTNNGSPYTASRISVWGVPTSVNQIELFYWWAMTVGALNAPVTIGPGYFRALMLNLAVEAADAYERDPRPGTVRKAAEALAKIRALNAPDMTMHPDPGMPGSKGRYLTKAQFLSGVW
jgi:hypothetical protein